MLFEQGSNHQLMMHGLIESFCFLQRYISLRCINVFVGNKSRLLFTSATESVVEKHRTIGQLSALAILHLGRGRHCFHPFVINYMFYSQVDKDPRLVDHVN